MNKARTIAQAFLTGCFIVILGAVGLRIVYADRIQLGVYVGAFPIGGMLNTQITGALIAYQQELQNAPITIFFRGRKTMRTFQELGITVDVAKTTQVAQSATSKSGGVLPARIQPVLVFQDDVASEVLTQDFAEVLSLPKDAVLKVDESYQVSIERSAIGEKIDLPRMNSAIEQGAGVQNMPSVHVDITKADPKITEQEVSQVQSFAQRVLDAGFHLTYGERSFLISRADVALMLQFEASPSPHVTFNSTLVRSYIKTTLSPQVYVEPINARFQVEEGVAKQFALPKNGIIIDADETIKAIGLALAQSQVSTELIVKETQPVFTDVQSSTALGITKLLATGESDFRGSPKNRTINVAVGADKFNGILVAPGEEFSFDALLGPVDASTGYKPELVIKNNATIPEYGGGLCQVSTTIFRTAMQAGVKITERHNHSYAVRYYGTPGFDATIYPPYTDLRFLNTTPGYLLIQTHIDGTKLFFEFWGTDDGRQVTIDGPHPYNRMPDGSVKAYLKRTVSDKDGNVLEDDTFNSTYKSPALYPHEPAKQSTNTTATTTG